MDYLDGQAVKHLGRGFVAITDHTADLDNEPGVGVDWRDYWQNQEEYDSPGDVIISTWDEADDVAGSGLIVALEAMDGHQVGTIVSSGIITSSDNIRHDEQGIIAGASVITAVEEFEDV